MKSVHAVAAVFAIVVVIAAAYLVVSVPAAFVVSTGDNVSVYYTGSFTNGTVFNSNVGQPQPFTFTVGANQVIPGFDQAVIGMKLNQTKNVTIPVDEAYGPVNQSLILHVPLSDFGNKTVTVGTIVTNTYGYQGEVIAVNATNATVNFNPPLAGKTLVFSIRVVKISKHV
jgi:FKBP-type peptidyl-prolyl cis-trans isomerase 2